MGNIDDYRAETIDIFPTIADALGIPLPWETDGMSLLAPDLRLKPFLADMPYSSRICSEMRSAPAFLTSSSTFTMCRYAAFGSVFTAAIRLLF